MRVRFRFYVIIIVLIVIVLAVCLFTLPFFKTQSIEVKGSDRADEEMMEALLHASKDSNIFLVNRDELKKQIEKDPYLVYERVSFRLPGRVIVHVDERQPQYYLEHLGNYLAVSGKGIVLSATKQQQIDNIPIISGLTVTSFAIGETVVTDEDIRLIALNKIMEKFEESGMTEQVQVINVSDVVHITMQSKQGYNILFGTSDDIERKIEWLYTLILQLQDQDVSSCTIDVSSSENPSYKIEK